jgi:hypothetical protein
MRIAVGFLTLVLVAACANEDGLAPQPTDQARARFVPGGVVNAIQVDAVNRLPLRSVELIAPDGQTTAASYLHVNSGPSVTYSQRFAYGAYGGNAPGLENTVSGNLFPADIGGAPQSNAQLLAMVSTASIPLTDDIEYRRDWRSYRIFLSFGDLAGEVERRVLPAPEPPPNG